MICNIDQSVSCNLVCLPAVLRQFYDKNILNLFNSEFIVDFNYQEKKWDIFVKLVIQLKWKLSKAAAEFPYVRSITFIQNLNACSTLRAILFLC